MAGGGQNKVTRQRGMKQPPNHAMHLTAASVRAVPSAHYASAAADGER